MARLRFSDHFNHLSPHLLGDGREFGRITGLLHLFSGYHHATLMRVRTLDLLIQVKGQFGPDAARTAAALLDELKRTRFRKPENLIRLHETVLFRRAYPQSRPSI